MGAFIDLTGQCFDRLTVIEQAGRGKSGAVQWVCICSCGTLLTTCGNSLRHGRARSCGCLQRETAARGAIVQPEALIDRLRRYTVMGSTDECWIWFGYKNVRGYGMIRYRGKQSFAHRMSYEIFKGPIPDGALILHSCDNPSCVNPNHLSSGSYQDNMNDMKAKNRQGRTPGSTNGNAKLNEETVLLIRSYLAKGNSLGKTAQQFGVSKKTVLCIKKRETWAHI